MDSKTIDSLIGVTLFVFILFVLPSIYRRRARRQAAQTRGTWVAPPDPARGSSNFRQTLQAAIDATRERETDPALIYAISRAPEPDEAAPAGDRAPVSVVLVDGGSNAVRVIKCLHRFIRPDLDLALAKRVYDNLPQTVKESVSPADAALIKGMLEASGATVRIQ